MLDGNTLRYTYDKAGNILTKSSCPYTTGEVGENLTTKNYGYSTGDWKDLLTSFDGQSISYDPIGNPINYYNGMQFTWSDGRKLTHAVLDSNKTLDIQYDVSGLMYQKTMTETGSAGVHKVVTEYYYSGGALMSFQISKYLDSSMYESNRAWLLYDETGDLIGIKYGGVNYYYSKNIQGDVLALVKQDGTVAARYGYDAWGKLLSVTDGNGNAVSSAMNHIGNINPMRYRGYYYDSDLGLYYLQSRFYDAGTGRFINADGYVSTGQGLLSQNMFAYCLNNPVMLADPSGNCTECRFKARGLSPMLLNSMSEIELYRRMNCPELAEVPTSTFVTDEIRVCTDGKKPGEVPDKDARHDTAYSLWIEKVSVTTLNPYTVPYVVIPMGSNIANRGDKALLINHTTGKSVMCVVGEEGPAENGLGEVSIKAIWDTGNPNHMTANSGPAGRYEIRIYKGQSYGFDWNDKSRTVFYTWEEHLRWRLEEDGY